MMTKPRTRLTPAARTDQLLDTSKQMIKENGLQAFTMESLARTANVSSPLVYNYFASRQALLQALLAREHKTIASTLTAQVAKAKSFEEVVRVFIASNFDHHASGNILPVLQSQPEIANSIKELRKKQSKQTAQYLVQNTAKTYQLTIEQAQLAVTMSSGASIAAADLATMSKLGRKETIDMVLEYIMAGFEGLANRTDVIKKSVSKNSLEK